ncbi:MAG: penicillin-binding protein [Rhodospirillales bacterium CG15_BIG_FIL_POST_REV_8_21_14_020_66_15]|nr:MAG: penicillin-binding protein [Rhodospirillales bacterium CG15_BIG_FIL_POST_REV_8_21_14_020_66_15]
MLRGALKWTAAAAVWAVVAVLAGGVWISVGLPDLDEALKTERRPTVTLLAADGAEIFRAGDLVGETAALKDLPPHLIQAVLATEDRRFYSHFGIDPIGLARAMYRNIRAGRIVEGGSTITQQLAKNLFLTPARTYVRKLQEMVAALWLEVEFTKDQILEVYLNRVYLGAGTYGVDAAAQRFFRKSARRLNLYEAAVVAGLLKAPSRYNPVASPERAHARARTVLANMVAAGYLSDRKAAEAARGIQVAVVAAPTGNARHFVDWVLDAINDYVTAGGRDLVVRTTLDIGLQRQAETAMARAFLAADRAAVKAGEGALVALTPEGAVRAMVGGRDYGDSQFNRAVQAQRQPGSAFKPVVYLAALEAGMTPETPVVDHPVSLSGWQPANFSGKYEGRMTLEQALANSVNTVAVQLAQKVGPARIIDTARALGISSDLPRDAGLALGTGEVNLLELTAAYAVLARSGMGVWPYAITEIAGPGGLVLYKRRGSGPGRAVPARAARTLTEMMTKVIDGGTGKHAAFGRPAAAKTGTSQDYRDAWFVGFTPQLVAGVWFGNDDGAPMKRVTGGGLPARTWAGFMAAAHQGLPVVAFDDVGDDGRPGSGSFWSRLKNLVGSDSGTTEPVGENRAGD